MPSEDGGEGSSNDPAQEQSQQEAGEPSPPSTPEEAAKQRVERARERMKQAQRLLDSGDRKKAVEEQKAAEKELKEAVEELEKILRQMREEEVERSLEALESRFRKMLQMQQQVLEGTKQWNALEGEARQRQRELQGNRLAQEERKIVLEGQRAMMLLQEEGSSTAFPEAVSQILVDMEQVADWLSRGEAGEPAIGRQEEIIEALEELLASLTEAIKERKEQKESQQGEGGGQQGGSQEQPLVDALAELRLIKTLQVRVNQRTEKLAGRLSDPKHPTGQATDEALLKELAELAKREEKLREVTREIVRKIDAKDQ
jgi:hypothetical protein